VIFVERDIGEMDDEGGARRGMGERNFTFEAEGARSCIHSHDPRTTCLYRRPIENRGSASSDETNLPRYQRHRMIDEDAARFTLLATSSAS